MSFEKHTTVSVSKEQWKQQTRANYIMGVGSGIAAVGGIGAAIELVTEKKISAFYAGLFLVGAALTAGGYALAPKLKDENFIE